MGELRNMFFIYLILFQTLATSELASLDINKTSSEDIRHAFCRDIARVARSYEVKIKKKNVTKF
jgi:hypothetical protein